MDAKRSSKDSTVLITHPLRAAPPDVHINVLRELREYYESGEIEDDEENEGELMIQLSGMTYNDTENDN